MRSKSSAKNLVVALIGQAFGLIISFIARIIFVKFLSDEYLGLNGLFTNLLTMLSLVELGVGSALVYSLYKPLADGDNEKVKSLMDLYRKAYNIIGGVVLIIGILFIPFYRYLISEVPSISHLDFIYILFVLNTAISYFYSYKRSLIICDQKRYIATIYRYVFYFLLNVFQIIVLFLTHNYILYLITQVVFTWLENICISIKADRMYTYLNDKNIKKLDKKELNTISKNVRAMLFHKIGGVVVNSTDNILISKLVGLIAVGMYSNYYLITSALDTITAQFFNAITASVGNLGACTNSKKVKETFNTTFFLNYLIYGVITVCLLILFNPFIEVWLGKKYLFDFGVVLVITICFYLKGIRKTCLTFKDALGLFWQDRYKPIIESIINLVASIILGIKYGVLGIFMGTIISTVTTSLWIEPYVLYKYYFKENIIDYLYRFIKYTLVVVLTYLIVQKIVILISIDGILGLLIKGVVSLILSILIMTIVFIKTNEIKHMKKIFKDIKS